MAIILKSKAEMLQIWEACQVVVKVFEAAPAFIKPGISTQDVADFAEKIIRSAGAYPTCLGYGDPPFPGAICVSVNDEIVHGIPDKQRLLKEGDIVSLDVCATLNGFCADAARTYPVGAVSAADKQLIAAAEEAFFAGIKEAEPGKRTGDLGAAVQAVAHKYGYGVVREMCGHGIGRNLHEDPSLLNYGVRGRGMRFSTGMVLCCEPMFTAGSERIACLDDEWTIVSVDGSRSSHYENTFAITERGVLVFSLTAEERARYNLPDIDILN